jgi:type VI secretion system protein ImpK
MTDAFADLVMPVFRRVIELQDRLAWEESRSLEDVKQATGGWLEDARRRAMGQAALAQSFERARYGLVAWIDEVLTDSPWGAKMGSPEQILEWDLFRSRDRAYRFYQLADEAEDHGDTDALATYLLCVTLGFKGEYRHEEAGLADWVQRVYDKVSAAGAVPSRPFPDDPPRKQVFGPLRGTSLLLTTSILVSITALTTLFAYLLAVHIDYYYHS